MGGLVLQQYLVKHNPPAAALLAPAPPGGISGQLARLSLDDPWLALETLLALDPGRAFSTPERARKYLFSPDLEEEVARRYVTQLGRESFRAIMELSYLRPDPARVRGTPHAGPRSGARLPLFRRQRSRVRRPTYGAELQILPDIAHDLMLDTDWRRAADALLEWLTGTLEARPA